MEEFRLIRLKTMKCSGKRSFSAHITRSTLASCGMCDAIFVWVGVALVVAWRSSAVATLALRHEMRKRAAAATFLLRTSFGWSVRWTDGCEALATIRAALRSMPHSWRAPHALRHAHRYRSWPPASLMCCSRSHAAPRCCGAHAQFKMSARASVSRRSVL